MITFTIENETDNIMAHATAQEAEAVPNAERFRNQAGLAKLAANWPADRLVQVWNSFAGIAGIGSDLKPVKKFTDRKTAIKRIWAAIQKLAEIEEMDEHRTRIRDAEAKLKAARAKLDAPGTPEASTATRAPLSRASFIVAASCSIPIHDPDY